MKLLEEAARAHAEGRLDEAILAYEKALAIDPSRSDVRCNYGVALKAAGRLAEAIAALEASVASQPAFAAAHNNLGSALEASGDPARAEARYRGALAADPSFAAARFNLGALLHRGGRHAEAIEELSRAGASAEASRMIGLSAQALGDRERVYGAFTRAVLQAPGDAAQMANLCAACETTDRIEEAIVWGGRAIEAAPSSAVAWLNLGSALRAARQIAEAIVCFDRAIALDSAMNDARVNRAMALLQSGDFRRGWPEYEARLRGFDTADGRRLQIPRWNGAPQDRLLVTAEQGLGDTLQFLRYLPPGATLECPATLQPLLRSRASVIAAPCDGAAFSGHVPLLSLPLYVRDPRPPPYLAPDPERAASWRERIRAGAGARLHVGLAWQGNPAFSGDHKRSIPRVLLDPLFSIPGVHIHPLHKHGEIDRDGAFVDTAAIIASLDLVISCDTSIAHLAGALGAELWLALAYVPDWRWGLAGERTAWYPTARLFRQPDPGAWPAVIASMTSALRERTHAP